MVGGLAAIGIAVAGVIRSGITELAKGAARIEAILAERLPRPEQDRRIRRWAGGAP